MKLRSQSLKAQPAPRKPIPQIIPATQKMTASNLSSFLLRLPQEIKYQIYGYLLGGKCIVVVHGKPGNPRQPYRLLLSRSRSQASSAQKAFDVKTDNYRTSVHLTLNLLRTCRQIYHEARSLLYSTNTFCFQDANLLTEFVYRLRTLPSGQQSSALRKLALHIRVAFTSQERAWDNALYTVAHLCAGLQSVDISIDQIFWDIAHWNPRKNPSLYTEDTFLISVLSLGKLKFLREMRLTVTDHCRCDLREMRLTVTDHCRCDLRMWSDTQRLEWAESIRASILGIDMESAKE